ncbi:hypothetical protein GDO86_017053 [Hymenochirus boettgeri]|uniref:Uncharacterized protein n=1 Tax=Hymenochirus boettgeri TaxID=247094 RepID=A0A8T2INP9_9PIPI|nr:hypothetical protein GDO86_017053 [Hymenochirus boettgeri]
MLERDMYLYGSGETGPTNCCYCMYPSFRYYLDNLGSNLLFGSQSGIADYNLEARMIILFCCKNGTRFHKMLFTNYVVYKYAQ